MASTPKKENTTPTPGTAGAGENPAWAAIVDAARNADKTAAARHYD